VRVPTLIIWGVHDTALARGLAEASLALCRDGRLEYLEEATHWVQHEEPERVNRLLLEFLQERDRVGSCQVSSQGKSVP
jgi:pimeloyl-ACP methyl ester carboxylesterase